MMARMPGFNGLMTSDSVGWRRLQGVLMKKLIFLLVFCSLPVAFQRREADSATGQWVVVRPTVSTMRLTLNRAR